MKTIVRQQYGDPDVLRLDDVDVPHVADRDVLVRIVAASVNPYDWHFMTGLPYVGRLSFGLLKPKGSGLGADFAGTVQAVGEGVTQFRPGDHVFGQVSDEAMMNPSLGFTSLAEFACVSEDALAPKPSRLTFEQAAAVPMAAITALQGLRDQGGLRAGQKVLINGASGGVGTFAVQIAKHFGADVTGVCSTRNVELVRSLGADHVIDYHRHDFTRGDRLYDLILDNVGNRSLSACRRALRPKGVYVASFGTPEARWFGPTPKLLRMYMMAPFVRQQLVTWVAHDDPSDLRFLGKLLEDGAITPVIDATYPLERTQDAMRHLATGHARGKVVVTVDQQKDPSARLH